MNVKKQKAGKCRGCGADILWIKTVNKMKMPLDAEPVWVKLDAGGHTFIRLDGTFVFGTRAGDADDDPDSNFIEAYESHFATCKYAGDFRKPRKPREREPKNLFR